MWLFLSTCGASEEWQERNACPRSPDGRQCWLWLGLGMLNGGREGLFELGQQLQQQGEYQAALHCFLSCLLGLTHVQSFTSLPNCLHQVSQMWTGHTHISNNTQHVCLPPLFALHPQTNMHADIHYMDYRICFIMYLRGCADTFVSLLLQNIIHLYPPHYIRHIQPWYNTNVKFTSTVQHALMTQSDMHLRKTNVWMRYCVRCVSKIYSVSFDCSHF